MRALRDGLAAQLGQGVRRGAGVALNAVELGLGATQAVLGGVDGAVGLGDALVAALGGVGCLALGRLDGAAGLGQGAGGVVRAALGGLHHGTVGAELLLVRGLHLGQLAVELVLLGSRGIDLAAGGLGVGAGGVDRRGQELGESVVIHLDLGAMGELVAVVLERLLHLLDLLAGVVALLRGLVDGAHGMQSLHEGGAGALGRLCHGAARALERAGLVHVGHLVGRRRAVGGDGLVGGEVLGQVRRGLGGRDLIYGLGRGIYLGIRCRLYFVLRCGGRCV